MSNKQGDHDLIAGLRRGDLTAQETLLEQYGEPLVRFLKATCPVDQMEAEDIAVEALYMAIKRIATFTGRSEDVERDFRNWLFTIARNIWRTKWRKQSHEIQVEDLERHAAPESASESASPAKEALSKALAALPDQQRQVLLLHYGGLQLIEVAELLDVPDTTVRQWKRRGLEALRNHPDLLKIFKVKEPKETTHERQQAI